MKNKEKEGYKPSPGRNGGGKEIKKMENKCLCTYGVFSFIVVNY